MTTHSKKRIDPRFFSVVVILIIVVLIASHKPQAIFGRLLSAAQVDQVKEQMFRDVDSALQRAQNERVPILSPGAFEKAEALYREGLAQYERGDRLSDIREKLSQCLEQIDLALKSAKLSTVVLENLLTVREQVLTSGMLALKEEASRPEYFNGRFLSKHDFAGEQSYYIPSAEEQTEKAAGKVEDGDVNDARDIAANAERDYRRSIVEAVRTSMIADARRELERKHHDVPEEDFQNAVAQIEEIDNSLDEYKEVEFPIPDFLENIHGRIDQALAIGKKTTDRDIAEIIELAANTLKSVTRYHFTMVKDDDDGFVWDGVFDDELKSSHFSLKLTGENATEAEVYWLGTKAYGYPLHIRTWLQVAVPGEPQSYLHAFSGMMQPEFVTNISEEVFNNQPCYVLTILPDMAPIQSHAREFALSMAKQLVSESAVEKIIDIVEQGLSEASVVAKFWISKESYQVKRIEHETVTLDVPMRMTFTVADINDPEIQISPPPEVLEATGPAIPVGALLLKFRVWESYMSYWGWSENNHCMMTNESLKLIRDKDVSRKIYTEIYQGYPAKWGTVDKPPYYNQKNPPDSEPGLKDPPSMVGSWAEDAWDTPRLRDILYPAAIATNYQTYRANQHFGGGAIGLQYRWYFIFIGCAKPSSGNYYLSARDWGWDGGSSGDMMNFQGAIEAYNNYTFAGTKAAYLRMGHVLHLLQDLAQPDHAGRQDHAASALSDPQAFERFKVCQFVVAEAAVVAGTNCAMLSTACGPFYWACFAGCLTTAETIAAAACLASIDKDEVGFEWLVREKWNFSRKGVWQKLKIEKQVGTVSQPNPYHNYFKTMSDFSLAAAKSRNKYLPIGLDIIDFAPFNNIPGLNPEIELGTKEEEEYLELADEVIAKATNLGAGILQYFYEVANHPPYVHEVVVYQGPVQLSVDKITGEVFPTDPDKKPSANIKYRAYWQCHFNSNKPERRLLNRELKILKSDPLDPALYTYVLARVTSDMQDLTLTLRDPSGYEISSLSMPKIAPSSTGKFASLPTASGGDFPPTAYYAAFVSREVLDFCGSISLEFSGKDSRPHYSDPKLGRKVAGMELDSNPVTVAAANPSFPHNWIDDPSKSRKYEPGIDKNHKVGVYAPDIFETNDDPSHSAVLPIVKNGKKEYYLSFHSGNDKDYFTINYPVNSDCKGATKSNLFTPHNILPSFVQVCAQSQINDLILTFQDVSSQKYEFKAGVSCPANPNPLLAGSAAFVGIEDRFPDGKIRFVIEPKTNVYGKKEPCCYTLTIWTAECSIEKPSPTPP